MAELLARTSRFDEVIMTRCVVRIPATCPLKVSCQRTCNIVYPHICEVKYVDCKHCPPCRHWNLQSSQFIKFFLFFFHTKMGCESIQWHYVGFQSPARLSSGGKSIILSMLDRQSHRKTNCTGVSNANWSFDMNTSRTDSKGWSFTKRPTSGDVEIVSSPETV